MFRSVLVNPAMFKTLVFAQAFERKEFVEGANVANDQKPQKYTKDGVPVWTVEMMAVPVRGMSRTIRVNLPSPVNPSERFESGEKIQLIGAEYGVTSKSKKCDHCGNSGYAEWMTAAGIELAGEASKPHAVSNVA